MIARDRKSEIRSQKSYHFPLSLLWMIDGGTVKTRDGEINTQHIYSDLISEVRNFENSLLRI